MAEIASTLKVAAHEVRLRSYLNGEPVWPVTLEMDISSSCNRRCHDCPSTGCETTYDLDMTFVDRLFSCLEGKTRGLLLSGGEPTMSPLFPDVLRLARERGFAEIAVVTNGSFLDDRRVQDALLAHASTVRISLYDWGPDSLGGTAALMKRIESLRARIEGEGSRLQIGTSALTANDDAGALESLASTVRDAGAHWIYMHPTCLEWTKGGPFLADQAGVLGLIEDLQRRVNGGFRVLFYKDRYVDSPLSFSAYHASHFLLVIGADRMNYLATEVKYQRRYVIADLSNGWKETFLQNPGRIDRINSIESRSYPALNSRHRGILYSSLIDGLMHESGAIPAVRPDSLLFPHIL